MAPTFSHINLSTVNKSELVNFFTQIFDAQVKKDASNREYLSICGLKIVICEDEKINFGEGVIFEINTESAATLNDFLLKTQFFNYRSQLNEKLPEIQVNESMQFFDIKDPDGRIWRISCQTQISLEKSPQENKPKELS